MLYFVKLWHFKNTFWSNKRSISCLKQFKLVQAKLVPDSTPTTENEFRNIKMYPSDLQKEGNDFCFARFEQFLFEVKYGKIYAKK